MRSADLWRAAAVLVVALFAVSASAAEPKPAKSDYNKVDTFEPGRRYNCVPTPDRKGWDCSETGKSGNQDEKPAVSTEAAKPTPLESAPAPPMPAAPTTAAGTPAPAGAPAPAASPPAVAPASPPAATSMPAPATNAAAPDSRAKGSSLPSYLRVAPSSSAASAPASPPTPSAPAATSRPPHSTFEPVPPAAATATPPAQPPVREAAPPIPPVPAKSVPSTTTPPEPPSVAARPQTNQTKPSPERPESAAKPTVSPTRSGTEAATTSAQAVDAPSAKPPAPAAHFETPVPAQPSAPRPAPTPPVERAAPAAPVPATPSTRSSVRGNREFLALPGTAYVVELAHSAIRSRWHTGICTNCICAAKATTGGCSCGEHSMGSIAHVRHATKFPQTYRSTPAGHVASECCRPKRGRLARNCFLRGTGRIRDGTGLLRLRGR